MSENVSTDIHETNGVVSLSDGATEHKYYAPGVRVVPEVPSVGAVRLKSHVTVGIAK